MKTLYICILCLAALTPSVAQEKNDPSVFGVFVGTSPCQQLIRPLLHIPAKGNCDQVKWELTLHQDSKTGTPTSYSIKVESEFYVTNSTLKKTALPVVEGKWTMQRNITAYPSSVFYTLDSGKPETTLSFIQLDDNIIHVANADKSLMIGDGGQSYSLNRKDPKTGASVNQTIPVNTVDHTLAQIVFQGRTPCQEIARVSAIPAGEDCFKIKWLLKLNYDPASHAPSTFNLERTMHRQGPITGTWTILRGTKTNPQAIVYKLATNKPEESLYLLQADKHVLFFLDKEMNLLTGNQEFDYTLNFKSSVFAAPMCITQADAARILGEEAKVMKSTREGKDGYEKYKCTYRAADPDTTVLRQLDYIFEKYKDAASAKKTYTEIVTSNRGTSGQEKIAIGDEAWFHSDATNFCILIVRKDDKLVRLKVNKLTSKTSVQALKDIMKTITLTL